MKVFLAIFDPPYVIEIEEHLTLSDMASGSHPLSSHEQPKKIIL
jgi:hypothetical protein